MIEEQVLARASRQSMRQFQAAVRRAVMAANPQTAEKAHQEALKAILEAKGRVSRSELKQHAAGDLLDRERWVAELHPGRGRSRVT